MNIYTWSVWLHVLFAFIFFFVHGTSMAIALLLPQEKDLVRLKAYLDITGITIAPMGISLLGILVTSIYMGIAAGWVRTGWWGLSFLLFLVSILWMEWYTRKYYSPIRKALGNFYMTGFSTPNPAVEDKVVDMKEVEALIQKTNPRLLLTVGFVVVAVLLWLMRFKPF
jgi:hypothetical protein